MFWRVTETSYISAFSSRSALAAARAPATPLPARTRIAENEPKIPRVVPSYLEKATSLIYRPNSSDRAHCAPRNVLPVRLLLFSAAFYMKGGFAWLTCQHRPSPSATQRRPEQQRAQARDSFGHPTTPKLFFGLPKCHQNDIGNVGRTITCLTCIAEASVNTSTSRKNARVARNSSIIAVKLGSSDAPYHVIQCKISLCHA